MKAPRCIAICYVLDGQRLFAGENYDAKNSKKFYRPLGGAIEWGESAADAIVREFREEMGAELVNLRFQTVIENLFTFNGAEGHELVMVFSADFADRAIYQRESIACVEDNGIPFKGTWIDLSCLDSAIALYPVGLLEHLQGANPRLVCERDEKAEAGSGGSENAI